MLSQMSAVTSDSRAIHDEWMVEQFEVDTDNHEFQARTLYRSVLGCMITILGIYRVLVAGIEAG